MKQVVVAMWLAVMDNRHNPLRHLNMASQHYLMQVLGWMWSMVFSLSFLSTVHFGYVWLAHLLLVAGVAMTVAVFHQAEQTQARRSLRSADLSGAVPRCVWKLDSEA